jgi:hypothetical protein
MGKKIPIDSIPGPLSEVTYIDAQCGQDVLVTEWPNGCWTMAGGDEVITIGQEAMRNIARSVLSVAGEWSSFDH